MLTSPLGTFITITLTFVPGLLAVLLLHHRLVALNFLDRLLAIFLLSGVWNFLFFMIRMQPTARLIVYGLVTAGLAGWVAWRWLAGRLFDSKPAFSWRIAIVPVLTLLLGIVMVGFPLHKLNESRLQPAKGGDVEFFLYKTHLLRGGYSIFDDPYAGQVNFYGTFIPTQVALGTLIEGRDLVPHAETFRVVMAVLIFFLIYAMGRAMTLAESESVLLALISLMNYHIWSHLEFYVAPGMAFYSTLLFLYFLIRAWIKDHSIALWALAGLSAGMVIHTHPIHTIVDGSLTILALCAFVLHRILRGRSLAPSMLSFFAGGSFGLITYFLPLLLRYRFRTTSDFHITEPFDTTFSDFWAAQFGNIATWIGLVVTIGYLGWLLLKRRASKDSLFLIPSTVVFVTLLALYWFYRLYAIFIHRMSMYIDVADFMTLIAAVAWILPIVILLKIVRAKAALRWGVVVIVLLLMFPFSRYGTQLWSMTRLPTATGERALEGILADPTYVEFAEGLREALPLNAAVLMTPEVTHAFGSFFERRVIFYEAYAHSTVFLSPDFFQRKRDVQAFYKQPTDARLAALIRDYGTTHVLFTWLDTLELRRFLEQSTLLEESVSPNWRGVLFAVKSS